MVKGRFIELDKMLKRRGKRVLKCGKNVREVQRHAKLESQT